MQEFSLIIHTILSGDIQSSQKYLSVCEIGVCLKQLHCCCAFFIDLIRSIPKNLLLFQKLSRNFKKQIAINNIIASTKFLDIAEIATVVPIDKETGDKYDISDFRPFNSLKCF